MIKLLLLILLGVAPVAAPLYAAGEHQHHQHSPSTTWPVDPGSDELLDARFELLDGRGETVTEEDYRGRYLLVSFGFSHCKHVCPTILSDWARMMKTLPEAKAAQLQALMITLDPERDDPAHMDQYAKLFNPEFQGLSGSPEQIAGAAKNFRVTYHKVPAGDDYQINHSSLSYLVDPQGRVIDYYGFGIPSEQLADSIASHIL